MFEIPFQPISMTKKQTKFIFQFSKISHFMVFRLPGAPSGGPIFFLEPQNHFKVHLMAPQLNRVKSQTLLQTIMY
jgi:hypothetical protein